MDRATGQSLPAANGPTWMRLLGEFEEAMLLRCTTTKQARAVLGIARRFLWRLGPAASRWLITAGQVQTYLAELARSGAKLKTLWNHRSAVSVLCEFLITRGLLAHNPCMDVPLAPLPRRPPRFLTAGETAAALRAAARAGIAPEVLLALATGLRLEELARLEWADVDIERRTLLVRRGKGEEFRVVPLGTVAMEALACQRAISGHMRHVFPARRTFPGGWRYVDGQRSQRSFLRLFKPVQAAVPKFRQVVGTGRAYHLLRHTFASTGAQAGLSLRKLGEWMGHSSTRSTEIYAHLAAGHDPDIELAGPRDCPPNPAAPAMPKGEDDDPLPLFDVRD